MSNTETTAMSRNTLSAERRTLVDLMRRTWYGRMLNLEIKDGEPVFLSQLRVIRERKFGAHHAGALNSTREDYLLKEKVRELFEAMDSLRNGTILSLEIREGLPWNMEWDWTFDAA